MSSITIKEEVKYINSQEILLKSSSNTRKNSKIDHLHLFILVHGLQGSTSDMKILHNTIADIYPDCVFLISKANQEDSELEIETMVNHN